MLSDRRLHRGRRRRQYAEPVDGRSGRNPRRAQHEGRRLHVQQKWSGRSRSLLPTEDCKGRTQVRQRRDEVSAGLEFGTDRGITVHGTGVGLVQAGGSEQGVQVAVFHEAPVLDRLPALHRLLTLPECIHDEGGSSSRASGTRSRPGTS